ncbi:cytochrome ubiquinol oxidase subunit I [Acidimangrovimonas sediminis]|uniref:cytochrome ubiquinol oxidase subunit I n=1 Tax=Acidimangrovimonas sediminis TaxID=2056283 RepID=UPI000C808365|nr:cytochrome ubiquinol oxidase subunit I [Acidimangrovimonas sediminis]
MPGSDLANLLARIDFGLITAMHIVYPPLTIGLSVLLLFGEWRWVRTDSEHWYRMTRFFEKLFLINFGAGVATGVTMELAFGILYGPFSAAAGPVFGRLLGFETITAFMYEAGFVGLMVFGWHKIGRRMHLFATFNVALASSISGFWILAANSWMQDPEGVAEVGGNFFATDWFKVIFNDDSLTAVPHMLIAALEQSLVVGVAVAAFFVYKSRHTEMFTKALRALIPALVIVAAFQIFMGDSLGQTVAHAQPAALAAMEGHYHTHNPDGSVNTGWHIVMWPNAKGDGTAWSITIPHVLSLLETHSWNGAVPGLDSIPPQDRPPVLIPFYAFRVMVAAGGAIFLLSLWGAWLLFRGRLSVEAASRNRWFLMAAMVSPVLPYIAIWTGWWTREVARQPWVVYGLMRTSEGRSPLSAGAEIAWFVGFAAFGLLVMVSTLYFILKVVRHGPDMTTPIPREGEERHEQLGSLPAVQQHAVPGE